MVDGESEVLVCVEPASTSVILPSGDSDRNFSSAFNSNFELPLASAVGVSNNRSSGMACVSSPSSSGMLWERRH